MPEDKKDYPKKKPNPPCKECGEPGHDAFTLWGNWWCKGHHDQYKAACKLAQAASKPLTPGHLDAELRRRREAAN